MADEPISEKIEQTQAETYLDNEQMLRSPERMSEGGMGDIYAANIHNVIGIFKQITLWGNPEYSKLLGVQPQEDLEIRVAQDAFHESGFTKKLREAADFHGKRYLQLAQENPEQGKKEYGHILDALQQEGIVPGMKVAVKIQRLPHAREGTGGTSKLIQSEQEYIRNLQQRFLNEHHALVRIKGHPNAVRSYTVVTNTQYGDAIVMEYLDGVSLDKYIRQNGKMSPGEVFQKAVELGQALEFFHKNGVVHRDLKPSNIMRCKDETLKILDFGVCKDMLMKGTTLPGQTVGSPSYMAPEQIEQRMSATEKADVYGLAMTMYELMAGTPLYTGSSPMQILIKVADMNAPHPDIQQGLPGMSDACYKLLKWGMAKEVNLRASMPDFNEGMKQILAAGDFFSHKC